MSNWQTKHVRGKNERIELQNIISGTSVTATVQKDLFPGTWNSPSPCVSLYTKGKAYFTLNEWKSLAEAVEQAERALGLSP